MLREKVLHHFENHPDLRVLFLFDPEGQFDEEFKNLNLSDIQSHHVRGDYFSIKHKLYTEWASEKVFLYFTITSPHKSGKYLEFPLLDILEANKEIITDDEEAFLEEFELARSQKGLVKKYMKELQYSSIQEVCRPILHAEKFDELTLQQGLIAAFLKFNKITTWPNILAKLLLLAKPDKATEWKRFLKKTSDMDLIPVLTRKIRYYFGAGPKVLNQEYLVELLQKIRYNQITLWIASPANEDPYAHLKIKEKAVLTYITQLLTESSQHPQINGKLQELLDWAGEASRVKNWCRFTALKSNTVF